MKKRKIKLKGLKTPKVILWIKGRRDGRAGTIVRDPETGWYSSFIAERERLYEKYCAEMWNSVAEELSSIFTKLAGYKPRYRILQEILSEIPGEQENYSCESVRMRMESREHERMTRMREEQRNLHEQLPVMLEVINQKELATEEALLSKKAHLEAQLNVYVRAALSKRNVAKDIVEVKLHDMKVPQKIYESRTKIENLLRSIGYEVFE